MKPNRILEYFNKLISTIGFAAKDPVRIIHFNNGPYVELYEKTGKHYIELRAGEEILHDAILNSGEWTRAFRSYYSKWEIDVYNRWGRRVHQHKFGLRGKRVRINIDSRSLGDTLAWIPQAVEFSRTHPATTVFVSHFWPLLIPQNLYPEIIFCEPESELEECYATYDIGYYFDDIHSSHPEDPRTVTLGKIAADILGIPYREIRPRLNAPAKARTTEEKYVCIATASTAQCKFWLYEKGWQTVVDHLNEKGVKVMVIQKENCDLEHVIDHSGDKEINQRIEELSHCEFMIGLGSGLSWLAWALEKPVILISGFSKPVAEFNLNCIRIINETVCHGCWNDTKFSFDRDDWNWCPRQKGTDREFECSKSIHPDQVIRAIDRLLLTK